MKYKHIVLFFGLTFVFFFATEFLMNYVFEDETPKWKLFAVSVVAAVTMMYPIVNGIKDFRVGKIFSRQKIDIAFGDKKLEINGFVDVLVGKLRKENFKITNIGKAPLDIRLENKLSWKTFGVDYSIIMNQEDVDGQFFEIASKPKYGISPVDSGFAYLKLKTIERIILETLAKQ